MKRIKNIILILILLIGANVCYGYNLRFAPIVNKNSKNEVESFTIITSAAAHESAVESARKRGGVYNSDQVSVADRTKWLSASAGLENLRKTYTTDGYQNRITAFGNNGIVNMYHTVGINFYVNKDNPEQVPEPTSNYKSLDKNNWVGYRNGVDVLTSKDTLSIDNNFLSSDGFRNRNNDKRYYITNKSSQQSGITQMQYLIAQKVDGTYKDYIKKSRFICYDDTNNNCLENFEWTFEKSSVQQIYAAYGLKSNTTYVFRFSSISGIVGSNYLQNFAIADTAATYYDVISSPGYNFSASTYGRLEGMGGLGATANEYDNIMKIPAMNNPVDMYVRSVDENGNKINVSGTLKDSDGKQIKSSDVPTEYKEHYSLELDKTYTSYNAGKYVEADGKVYEIVGKRVLNTGNTSTKYNEVKNDVRKNSLAKGNKNTKVDVNKDTKRYIFIEYVYKKVPDTPVDYGPGNADAGKFNKLSLTGTITNGEKNISIKQVENESSTCNSGDKNEDKSVLYVPAGEKVNLKITSQKFFYKKLTQKPYVENGELKWKIVAEMYVLNPNSSRAKNSDDSGTTFFGNTRENVINASSPLSLRNTSGIDQESIVKDAKNYIKNSLKDYVGNTTRSISSLGQITMNSVGSVTAEEKNLTVNKERYNGKRTVAGDSSYVEYTFTYEKDKDITTKKVNNSILTLNTNSTSINIYTPLDVSNVKIKSDSSTMVNHSDNKDATQIQKGSTFTINPKEKATFNYPGAGVIDTSKYAKGYILVFDFGVNDKAPGTQFEIGANDVFTGTVTGDINQANNSFKIMGITYNEPDNSNYNNSTGNAFKTEMESTDITTTTKTSGNTTITSSGIKYKYKEYIDNGSIGQIKVNQNACGKNIYTSLIPGVSVKEGAYYRVVHKVTTINIGRIYGFRVTDCSDVNWKNVFRNSSGDVVNSVTGTVYFSGKKVYDYLTNSMQSAKDARGATNILPLAPYKSTTTTYIQAPKLGYRISFDLKTSGYYDYVNAAANAQRKVTIQPSYYFINKDGSGYTSDIELYYKNKSGKYVRFENSGYSISFTPNDGYRHTFDDSNTSYKFNTDIMSDKLLTLNISKVYELYSGNGKDSRGMMAIDTANNDSVQVWFGEFKLPNSTIAIKKGGNVNQPLTDGYIGVKFDIKCIDEKSGITLDYNHENTAADKDSKTNTTQWDYDEYLGYTGIGKTFDQDIPLQLEKGTWHINSQDEWNKIKGTVILYDADNRAADDFE